MYLFKLHKKPTFQDQYIKHISFFQDLFPVQSLGCPLVAEVFANLPTKTYISGQRYKSKVAVQSLPSVMAKCPAIFRPSPRYNPTDSKTSVRGDLNNKDVCTVSPPVSPPSSPSFQDHLLSITLPL